MAAAAAVCITGQLRTFVAANLHTQLRTTVLDVLPADAFLSVDAADTRSWGDHHASTDAEFAAALQTLRPVAAEKLTLLPPQDIRACAATRARTQPAREGITLIPQLASGSSASRRLLQQHAGTVTEEGSKSVLDDGLESFSERRSSAQTFNVSAQRRLAEKTVPASRHVCVARDCGTFTCGCYRPECTECEASIYLPMHEHNRRCMAMVISHEASRSREYEWVIKLRPDLLWQPLPWPSLSQLSSDVPASPPTICAKIAVSEGELAGRMLDDKWAIMRRSVADVYMNASNVFNSCEVRAENELTCQFTRAREGRSLSGKSRAKFKGGRGREPPSWATPQCILGRYLTRQLPTLHVVNCLPVWPKILRPEQIQSATAPNGARGRKR